MLVDLQDTVQKLNGTESRCQCISKQAQEFILHDELSIEFLRWIERRSQVWNTYYQQRAKTDELFSAKSFQRYPSCIVSNCEIRVDTARRDMSKTIILFRPSALSSVVQLPSISQRNATLMWFMPFVSMQMFENSALFDLYHRTYIIEKHC